MQLILAVQTDKLAEKALDTIVQAIQGGLVGVAIILAAALIVLAVVLMVVIRSSNRNILELLKYNGRLADSISKMDATLDKMSDQQEQSGKLFAELTATLREIPQHSQRMLEQIGLMRQDLATYSSGANKVVTEVESRIQDMVTVIERRLNEINAKLQKLKPDTQPIPALTDTPPAPLPEAPKPDLLEAKNETETE